MKKRIKKIIDGILIGLIVLMAGAILMGFINKKKDRPVTVFNHCVYVVVTDSMTPTIAVGDVYIAKVITEAEVDDIVTYRSEVGVMNGKLVTHRVVKKYVEDGQTMYVTQGDKPGASLDTPIREDQLVSKMERKLYILTIIYMCFTNKVGFVLLVFIPLVYMLISELIHMIKNFNKEDKSKKENTSE